MKTMPRSTGVSLLCALFLFLFGTQLVTAKQPPRIAVELSGIKGITIVDRERRNAIMEEQKFALSDAADEAGNVELGKLLAANYLLSGSLFDMFGQLEVTVKLVDVQKGIAALSA